MREIGENSKKHVRASGVIRSNGKDIYPQCDTAYCDQCDVLDCMRMLLWELSPMWCLCWRVDFGDFAGVSLVLVMAMAKVNKTGS